MLVDSLAERLGLGLTNERAGYVGRKDVMIGESSVKLTLFKTSASSTQLAILSSVLLIYSTIAFCSSEALMNLSGAPVSTVLRSTGLSPSSLIVIHDSLSHKPLVISPKFGGSANGHNGVRSIITALGSRSDFFRLRVGIGKNDGQDAADYVMNKLSEDERNFWGRGGKGVHLAWEHIEKFVQAASPSH